MVQRAPIRPTRARLRHALVREALEVRFDHLSAQTVLAEALVHAEMEPAGDYTPEEASRIAWALTEVADQDNVRPAVRRLLEFVGEAATSDVIDDPVEVAERRRLN